MDAAEGERMLMMGLQSHGSCGPRQLAQGIAVDSSSAHMPEVPDWQHGRRCCMTMRSFDRISNLQISVLPFSRFPSSSDFRLLHVK